MYLPILRVHLKKQKTSAKDVSNDAYAMFSGVCMCVFLIFFMKVYVAGTHFNCIDLSMQFKWVPTTYALIKTLDKKYTGCNR